MLERFPIGPTLAASDVARAKQWYADKLGLHPTLEEPGAGLIFPAGGQSLGFSVYLSPNAGPTARPTPYGWWTTWTS